MLPQAIGIAMARVPRITGAFHGAMPSTTPAGWRMPMASAMPGLFEGIISPVICVVIAPASRSMPAASITLKPAHGAVAPVSSITSRVNSPTLLSMMSAAFISIARRSPGPVLLQVVKATAAASTAAISVGDAGGRSAGRELAGKGSWRS